MPGKPIRVPRSKADLDKIAAKKRSEDARKRAKKNAEDLVKAFDPRSTLLGRLVGALRSNKARDKPAFKPK